MGDGGGEGEETRKFSRLLKMEKPADTGIVFR